VVIDRFYSPACYVTSGVPQSSILGLILFVVFTNDINLVFRGDAVLKLFADDVKLYSEIDLGDVSASLELSLDNLTQWAKDWQLTININKCSIMSTNTNHHYSRACFNHIDGTALRV
jgi:hypothetical protein